MLVGESRSGLPVGMHRSSRAFTLIELLVVMAILGVLAAVMVSAGSWALRRADISRARGEP